MNISIGRDPSKLLCDKITSVIPNFPENKSSGIVPYNELFPTSKIKPLFHCDGKVPVNIFDPRNIEPYPHFVSHFGIVPVKSLLSNANVPQNRGLVESFGSKSGIVPFR